MRRGFTCGHPAARGAALVSSPSVEPAAPDSSTRSAQPEPPRSRTAADDSLEAWLNQRDPKLGAIAASLVAAGLDDPATLLAMSRAEWDELLSVGGIQLTPLQAILMRSRVRSLLRDD